MSWCSARTRGQQVGIRSSPSTAPTPRRSSWAAYARADAVAVTSFLGFPASQVQRLAGHWISLVSTDAGYQTVSQGVTLASALGEETIASPEKVGAPTVLDVVGSDGSKTSARFSAWGAVAPLTAPSGAIPAATVPVDASS